DVAELGARGEGAHRGRRPAEVDAEGWPGFGQAHERDDGVAARRGGTGATVEGPVPVVDDELTAFEDDPHVPTRNLELPTVARGRGFVQVGGGEPDRSRGRGELTARGERAEGGAERDEQVRPDAPDRVERGRDVSLRCGVPGVDQRGRARA